MLTPEHLEILRRKFRPEDHEFRQNKFIYLTEDSITDRLDEVDPSWTFDILDKYARDNQVVVIARMTIHGVWRDGIGMQDIKESVGEPEKGAATDALKRCARLFGIGRYILTIPTNVTTMQSLTVWLKQNASPSPQKPLQSDFQQNHVSEEVASENGAKTSANGTSSDVTKNWKPVNRNNVLTGLKDLIPTVSYQERGNTTDKLYAEGAFAGKSVIEAIELVVARINSHKQAEEQS